MAERPSDGWLVERGIGEERAIRSQDGEIVAARIHWPGNLTLGQVEDAVVVSLRSNGAWRNSGIVRFANGQEAHASRIPRETTEGMRVRQKVTREAIAERGRLKIARSTFTEEAVTPPPGLLQQLTSEGADAREVTAFPGEADWDELFIEAWTGEVPFSGGSLILSPTPAMTLIDVDLHDYPEALYHNGIPVLARTLARMNIGGNIGIDFPTLDKSDRKAIDDRLSKFLADWPHERTAMNGFGFVQIVARLEQPSMLQRLACHRVGAAARFLLRRAERLEGAGKIELAAHPAVIAKLTEEWLAELQRRTGREVSTRPDPTLAIEAPHAQLVPR
ncbi:ribonuclease [Aurantiacibacter sp. MUD11]|uniref:ribonuclease n=1 Tax=Aurantiacibacter sp. MUD11 TaxID=3003265 RepID=UPI0022AA22C1|nr:ribonuclease [Aurantiacibacter sp. MUD11]WAT18848.1 ribonuclease [Aurantiacibacter sp. MUD11]